jgi:uncharacterized protein (TIGR03435 family)
MTNKRSGRVAAALLLAACAAFPQTPAALPAFEVATIKPAAPITPQAMMSGKVHIGLKIESGRVDIGFMSLSALIGAAYEVKPYQITGPDWITSERFDIMAKLPEGATKEQVPDMLKALLAERFKLTVHHEGKEHPIYELVVGKNGSKLNPSPSDVPADITPPADSKGSSAGFTLGSGNSQMRVVPSPDGKGATTTGGETGKTAVTMGPDGMMHMEIEKMTMAKLAETLSGMAGRPVLDKTGLAGNYQVALDLSMQDMMSAARAAGVGGPGMPAPPPADAASDPSGGSAFTSVEKLGLRLEPKKESIDSIVVDHIEKTPTEN